MTRARPYRLLAPVLLAALAGAPRLPAQSVHPTPAAPSAPAAMRPTPAAPVMSRGEATARASVWGPAWAPAGNAVAGRRRAFHVAALAGAGITGTVASVAVSRAGDAENRGPGPGAVAAAGVLGAVVGGLLGGVAGIVVHDIGEATTRR